MKFVRNILMIALCAGMVSAAPTVTDPKLDTANDLQDIGGGNIFYCNIDGDGGSYGGSISGGFPWADGGGGQLSDNNIETVTHTQWNSTPYPAIAGVVNMPAAYELFGFTVTSGTIWQNGYDFRIQGSTGPPNGYQGTWTDIFVVNPVMTGNMTYLWTIVDNTFLVTNTFNSFRIAAYSQYKRFAEIEFFGLTEGVNIKLEGSDSETVTANSGECFATMFIGGFPTETTASAALYYGTSDQGETHTGWLGAIPLGTATEGVQLDEQLSGLDPDTGYYFRFFASNLNVTANNAWSEARAFWTLGPEQTVKLTQTRDLNNGNQITTTNAAGAPYDYYPVGQGPFTYNIDNGPGALFTAKSSLWTLDMDGNDITHTGSDSQDATINVVSIIGGGSFAFTSAGLTINAANKIAVDDIDCAGSSAPISLTAVNDINLAGAADASNGGGNGSSISMTSSNGHIVVAGLVTMSGSNGTHGDMALSATNGSITVGGFDASKIGAMGLDAKTGVYVTGPIDGLGVGASSVTGNFVTLTSDIYYDANANADNLPGGGVFLIWDTSADTGYKMRPLSYGMVLVLQ